MTIEAAGAQSLSHALVLKGLSYLFQLGSEDRYALKLPFGQFALIGGY